MTNQVTAIVIDNDKDMVDVFADYLEIKKIKVLARGYNGKEAVDLYKLFNPDLIFIDLVMPEYDGLYALQNIREYDPHSKVVIITANKYYGNDLLQELKPTGIFYKPFDISKIVEMLMTLKLA